MGFFRFFLAALVVASHLGITFSGLNPGVSAVVVFYFLAGSVVMRLWQRLQSADGRAALPFLVDRFWRIAPMYYFILAVALAVWIAGAESYFLSGLGSGSMLCEMAGNLFVVPLNYYMYSGIDTATLIPPAWSLAVELQFYLLMPVLLLRRRWLLVALGASLVLFSLAQGPWLNTDVFGYRLLPGVLFIFLCGALPESHYKARKKLVWLIWGGVSAYALVLFLLLPQWHAPFNREVALGFAIGVPLVLIFAPLRFRGAMYKANRYAGVLSYGVFLGHFPVIWFYQIASPGAHQSFLAVLAGSSLLALAGHFLVEKPLWRKFRTIL
ncbi:MAG: acyltransferase [Pseudomonadota bacterium]|nr:acyltransferase [Pseudomonadota bacterium]